MLSPGTIFLVHTRVIRKNKISPRERERERESTHSFVGDNMDWMGIRRVKI